MTIEVPDDVAELLRERAEETGQDVNAFAVDTLVNAIATPSAAAAPDHGSDYEENDPEGAIAGIAEGLADVEAGRTRPLADFIAEQEAFWQSRSSKT